MTTPCPECEKQMASPSLLELHLHTEHGHPQSKKAKRLLQAQSKLIINAIPVTPQQARRADKRTRSKPSKSVKTVAGGRSKSRFS